MTASIITTPGTLAAAPIFLAQTTEPGVASPATQPGGVPARAEQPPFWANPLVLPVIVIAIFWIFMLRSKRGTETKRQDMLSALKKNDEIQTIGGVIGKVMEAREDRVLVKVDENSNTKIWFARSAIHRVLTEDKAETK